MIILAVDIGKVRTGIAVCDKEEILASPVEVIKQVNKELLCTRICEIARERKAEMIVVGLPRNMDGTEGDSAVYAREFAGLLLQESGLPVELTDERRTTVTAYQYLDANNTYGKKRKAVVDSIAATVILENYLQFRKNHSQS